MFRFFHLYVAFSKSISVIEMAKVNGIERKTFEQGDSLLGTIPKAVQQALGLEKGDKISWFVEVSEDGRGLIARVKKVD